MSNLPEYKVTVQKPSPLVCSQKVDSLNNIYGLLAVLEDYLCFHESGNSEKNRIARNGAAIIVQQLMDATEHMIREESEDRDKSIVRF